MELTRQDLEQALSAQTKNISQEFTKNLEDLKTSVSSQINGLREELEKTKEELESTKDDMTALTNEIQREVIARLRIANQIYIGNATSLASAKAAIDVAGGGNIQPKSIEPIEIKTGRKKEKIIGHIAEMGNVDEKIITLKGSKKLAESDQLGNIFLKSNQTKKRKEKRKRTKTISPTTSK